MSQSSGSGGKGYDVTSSGTNSQGNRYDSRDYTPSTGGSQANDNTYHYSNNDGSYYYSNSNGSTYHNDGNGGSKYTAPGGKK
ncbi:hypothetical protein HO133_002541 [Letharia lupina]|uniref:Uncharacterized protein n=2 Tax=Letharia TaxID=112415 RepID=A0A8H6CCN8_9LECA|nr:uncharacterized protein HO133_002541 [Letharia lupina]XP_037166150.1 uncharacterized protein HO173_005108 [Letharia columbiana]KAF6220861.1 hypothetical protein HO133_002541 [Letharia lupina]KAF6236817.1 hypothetical protein HO173_005108 [Letharia columbiana]